MTIAFPILDTLSPKRSETEIVTTILRTCQYAMNRHGADKLQIMNAAFLQDSEATSYLSKLVTDGLLEYDGGLKRYDITAKGRKFLDGG